MINQLLPCLMLLSSWLDVVASPYPLERYSLTSCVISKDGIKPALSRQNSLLGILIPSSPMDFYCGALGTRIVEDTAHNIDPTERKKRRKRRLEGNRMLSAFRDHFKSAGNFSVSIWMTPMDPFYDGIRPFLTIGQAQRPDLDSKECKGFYLRLAQQFETLVISFIDSQGFCQHLRVNSVDLIRAHTHLIVAFGASSMQVYFEGVPVYRQPSTLNMTIDIRNWKNATTSTLQLFSNYRDDREFLGMMDEVDFYDVALNMADVATIFSNGIGHLDPTVSPTDKATHPPTKKPTVPRSLYPSQAPVLNSSPQPSELTPSDTQTRAPTEMHTSFPSKALQTAQPTATLSVSPSIRDVLPSHWPNMTPPTSNPVNVALNEDNSFDWQTLAFSVIGLSMLCFCVWSFCGGWPRFVARRSRSVETHVQSRSGERGHDILVIVD